MEAKITLTRGMVLEASAITIGEQTIPIPEKCSRGTRLGSRRIIEAAHQLGYKPATNYYDDLKFENGLMEDHEYVLMNVVALETSRVL